MAEKRDSQKPEPGAAPKARPRPKRPRRRSVQPATGQGMVDRALRRLNILDKVRTMQALRAYALACGPRFLARSRAERFQPDSGTLTVRLESSAWASEMVYVREQLLSQIRKVPGGEGVRSLRFTVGPLGDPDTPGLDGRPGWPGWVEPAPKEPPPPKPLDCDPRVAAALTQVDDDELRDALGSLYVRACRAGRR